MLLRISGCRIASSFRRLASSAKTSERSAGRFKLAGWRQHAGAELLDDGGQARLAERHDLARDDVRVDQRGAELDEHRAHERLAAGDAAGQADDETRTQPYVVRHVTTAVELRVPSIGRAGDVP